MLARQFRAGIDDLHGALLRVGADPAEDSMAVIEGKRRELSAWLSARQASPLSEGEKKIVEQIGVETRTYFAKLDALSTQTNKWSIQLDRMSSYRTYVKSCRYYRHFYYEHARYRCCTNL